MQAVAAAVPNDAADALATAPGGAYTPGMFGIIRRRRDDQHALSRTDEPNPAVALAVGLIYVFRTAAGGRIMRELEGAIRKYAADPQALWRLVREGGETPADPDVIDTTAEAAKELPGK